MRARSVSAAPSTTNDDHVEHTVRVLPVSASRRLPLQKLITTFSKADSRSCTCHDLHEKWLFYTQCSRFCDNDHHKSDSGHDLWRLRWVVSLLSECLEPNWLRYKTNIMDPIYIFFLNFFNESDLKNLKKYKHQYNSF